MNKLTPLKHKTPNYKIDRCGHWEAVPLRRTRKDIVREETKPAAVRVGPRRSLLLFAALAATLAAGR